MNLRSSLSDLMVVVVLLAAPGLSAVEQWADPKLPVQAGLELWLDASRENAAREGHLPLVAGGGPLDIWHDGYGHPRHIRQPICASQSTNYVGTLYKRSDSPLIFANSQAWVTVFVTSKALTVNRRFLQTYETETNSLAFETDDEAPARELDFGHNFGHNFGWEFSVTPCEVSAATTGGGTAGNLTLEDVGDFIVGFGRGFLKGGVSMVKDTLQLVLTVGRTVARLSAPLWVCTFGDCYAQEIQFLRKTAHTVEVLAEKVQQIVQDRDEAVTKALAGDLEGVKEMSEPYRHAVENGVELLQAMWRKFADGTPGYKGEVLGRGTFEIVSAMIPWSKVGQLGKLSKLEFLTGLRNVPFFASDARRLAAVEEAVGEVSVAVAKSPNTCFAAGTQVHSREGLKNIECIQPGDWVLSRNPANGAQGFKPVVATFVTHPARLYHLTYRPRAPHAGGAGSEPENGEASDEDDARLVCTGGHPFSVNQAGGFVPAEKLRAGDEFRLADGRAAVLRRMRVEEAPAGQTFTTYNFEVAQWHTYFAGEPGVWVHNRGRECERIRGLFHRLRGRGYTSKQAFTTLVDDLSNATGKALKTAAVDANRLMYESGANLARSGQGWAAVSQEVMTLTESKPLLEGRLKLSRAKRGGVAHTGNVFEQHHGVPKAVQEVLEDKLGLPPGTWDYDDVPVMFLTEGSHRFPVGIHEFLNQQGLWQKRGMADFSPQDIVKGLRTAYLDFGDPNGWEVIRVWLKHKNVPFPPDIP